MLAARCSNLLELLGDEEAVLEVAEHGEIAEQIAGQPAAGQLKQGFRAGQAMKLLGEGLARQRPQPGACATAQDERQYFTHELRPGLRHLQACLA